MERREHWEHVYETKAPTEVSWFQEHAEQSLRLIERTGVARDGRIIDVGGGASTLVDDLLAGGYSGLTVLDLSITALHEAQERLGERAGDVHWIQGDILERELPEHAFDLWHDRAVFHFLTSEDDRHAYVAKVLRALKPGGHVIVATFAEDGPTRCSGLPVMRYSPEELHGQFGSSFALLKQEREDHHTPFGSVQKFIYCYCRVAAL